MTLVCTHCHSEIDSKLANVQTDLVKCPNCNTIHKVSELVETKALVQQSYELAAPPTGSGIDVFNTRSTLEMEIPPRKLNGFDLFPLGFSIAWLSFITFWTFMAAQASVFFALFSIPFWVVGFSMLSGVLTGLTERQFIELDNYSLRITKKGLLSKKVVEIDIEDIDKIGMKNVKLAQSFKALGRIGQMKNRAGKTPLLPTITHGIKDTVILDNVTEQEMEWGLELLKASLMRIAEKRV